MADATQLLRDGKIDAAAVERMRDAGAVLAALAGAKPAEALAAAALAAGRGGMQGAKPALAALLPRDGIAGRAAAWALAQLGAEAELLAAVDTDALDARENGYWGLMVLAARGAASPQLAKTLAERVDRELARVKAGRTGLGEHACRALAILGAPGVDQLASTVIEQDRFCDRFELQRLRKAVADGGRDAESVRELTAPFTTLFLDHIAGASAPPAPAPGPVGAAASAPSAPPAPATKAPPQGHQQKAPAKAPAAPPTGEAEDGEGPLEEGGPAPTPIDWKAFMASPEATKLPAPSQGLIKQLGPALEQLAIRAIQAPLTDLTGQEFAALLLQVLPQALPQQAVQAALSPQAFNAYQALARYLARTGAASHGEDLVQGVKLARKEVAEQIRRSGILGGPDYSDPDEPKIK